METNENIEMTENMEVNEPVEVTENDEMVEPMEREMEIEESPEDKLMGLTAEVNQMKWMIEENIRLIAEGDDVEGRTFLKKHLESDVRKKEAQIAKLQESIGIQEG